MKNLFRLDLVLYTKCQIEFRHIRPRFAPNAEPTILGAFCHQFAPRLAGLNIGGLLTLGALHHIEGNLLPFFQGFEAVHVDGGEMREQIIAAIIRRNKTKTFCIVEPLYCAS